MREIAADMLRLLNMTVVTFVTKPVNAVRVVVVFQNKQHASQNNHQIQHQLLFAQLQQTTKTC